jgi:hypothetical protein
MPVFQVPIQDQNGEEGTVTVNASDAQAASFNAAQGTGGQTNTIVGMPTQVAAGPNAQASSVNRTSGSGSGGGDQAALNQLISGQNAMLKAIADGNMEAFRESIRQFDLSFGLDQGKFAEAVRQFNAGLGVTEAGLTGTYQGQQTLQAQNQAFTQALAAAGLTGTYQGQQTLPAQQQYFNQGLQGMTLAAGLQANPFRQQQVLGQLGGLLGGGNVAGFQAPNTVPGVGTAGGNTQGGLGYMQQMIDDIRSPAANTANMNQVLNAIPTPNKLNSVQFTNASGSTKSMVLQGMQEKYGLDPNDALQQIQNTLPQFQAPTTVGNIRR